MKVRNKYDVHIDYAYSVRETAEILGVSMNKLNNDRLNHKGLPFVKLPGGGLIRYLGKDILSMYKANRVEPTVK